SQTTSGVGSPTPTSTPSPTPPLSTTSSTSVTRPTNTDTGAVTRPSSSDTDSTPTPTPTPTPSPPSTSNTQSVTNTSSTDSNTDVSRTSQSTGTSNPNPSLQPPGANMPTPTSMLPTGPTSGSSSLTWTTYTTELNGKLTTVTSSIPTALSPSSSKPGTGRTGIIAGTAIAGIFLLLLLLASLFLYRRRHRRKLEERLDTLPQHGGRGKEDRGLLDGEDFYDDAEGEDVAMRAHKRFRGRLHPPPRWIYPPSPSPMSLALVEA
ncbi:hypothetical protein DXG01_014376, partial [Tephrocybe rancida]